MGIMTDVGGPLSTSAVVEPVSGSPFSSIKINGQLKCFGFPLFKFLQPKVFMASQN